MTELFRTEPIPHPFVGRAHETGRLRSELERAARGEGRIVLVAGDRGIGKTWLVRGVLDRAHVSGDVEVRWARCSDVVGAPAYWAWQQLLGSAFDADWRAGADDATARFVRLHAIVDRLKSFCGRRPTVLAIDDLQWADEESLLVLDMLASEIDTWPLLVIATLRDRELRPNLVALRRHRALGRIELPGFHEGETRQLAQALVGGIVQGPAVAALHRATAGNPYFIGELVQSLTREQREALSRGEWMVSVPGSLDQLIAQRLAGCDADTRRFVEIAAVIGPTFSLGWIAALLPRGKRSQICERALDSAMRARLVEPAEGVGRFRFVHGLVPAVVLQYLPTARRAELHGRIGLLLEANRPALGARTVTELAHHFVAAATRPEFTRAAVRYSRRAGHEAIAQYAYATATRHYRNALAVFDGTPSVAGVAGHALKRADLLLELAYALAHSGDAAAASALDDVEAIAGRQLGGSQHERAARSLALATVIRCETLSPATAPECRAAWARGEIALVALGSGSPELRARLLAALTPTLRFDQSRERARALATEAIDIAAASGDAALQGRALGALHWALLDEPSADERLRITARVLVRAETSTDRWLEATARFWRYLDLLELGRIDRAENELATFERLAADLDEPRRRYQALYLRAGLEIHGGRLDSGEALAVEALRLGMRIGLQEAELGYATAMSVVCFARDDIGHMAELDREMAEMRSQFPETRIGSAMLLAWQGRTRSATDALAAVAESGRDAIPRGPDALPTLQTLAWLGIEINDLRLCERVYAQLLPHAGRTILHQFGAATGGSVARVLANLATKLGRFEEAEAHFHEAVAIAERSRAGFDLMFLPLERATLYLARGADRDDARVVELLQESLARARVAGAARIERRIRDLHPRLVEAPTVVTGARVQRRGETWAIAFRGRMANVADNRGLQMIVALLRRPGERILASELVAEITGETGIEVEKARLRVTQRILSAVKGLRDSHPTFAAHVGTYVQTGKYCGYLPRAEDRVEWEFDARPIEHSA